MLRARAHLLIAAVAMLLSVGAATAFAAFPQDPPNDPLYDRAEGQPNQFCIDDEQYSLFDFMPECTPAASDPENASGMSVNRAWRDFSAGSPDTVIAYVEAGINWRGSDIEELANKVYLNARELPAPTTDDGNPALRASDYADTPDHNGNKVVDPEDIIVRFSDKRDDDSNGYVDDISGWDFYTGTNNPATVDSAYEHANGQMKRAGAETDNAKDKAGICPRCRLLPVKAGAEALDRTDELAQAWLFAVDSGASVIVSVTADLGYSTFMRRTAEYVERKGVVAVEASNDFNSTDHQGGMFHPHVLPGNGVVADRVKTNQLSRTTRTYRERSSITSWGAHNVFSVPTSNGTTSSSTPTVGAVVALVMAYGRQAAAEGKIERPLTGPEAVQVLKSTSSDVNDPSLAWPNGPGWDLQFGYGRPNVHKAMAAVSRGEVPPVAAIDSPDWFTYFQPGGDGKVRVAGRVAAPRSGGHRWRLEMGVGPEPSDAQFRTIGSGEGQGAHDGTLGEFDPDSVPREAWSRAFELSKRKELETTERYTVTFRLRVTDAAGRTGEDRRAVFVQRDPSAVAGFPKRIGPGGEGQAALVDLQGRGRLAMVFGDTDGRVHAVDSASGEELPGWPVKTDPTRVVKQHEGLDPGNEPIVSNVGVGDLDGTGNLSVVASTTTGSVYAWTDDGKRRSGWPRALDRGVSTPPTPRPSRPFTRDPAQGAFAAPVLGDLDRDGRAEVIQAAWDGHLHVLRADGSPLRGWPVRVRLPDSYEPPPGYHMVQDAKLQGTPALADLDGDRRLEIVQRSQQTDILSEEDIQPAARGHLHAYRADGSPVPGWPTTMQGVAEAYGTAQEFITEGSNSPIAADVDGNGDDEIVSNPVFTPPQLYDGDGSLERAFGPVPDVTALLPGKLDPAKAINGDLPADAPVSFTTSAAYGRFAGGGSIVQPGSGTTSVAVSLVFPGLGAAIKNYEQAFDARSGAVRPGFPAQIQGLNFLGAPLIVDVTGDGEAEVVDGGDSNAVHGFSASGAQAAGFPKFHTGWNLWSPSAGDLDGDGTTEIVTLTREGYLFAWHTKGRASSNEEWWRWHHDEHSSGRYGADTRPPGVVRSPSVARDGGSLAFLAPGDDWYTGRAKRYEVTFTTRGGRASASRRAGAARAVNAGGAAGHRESLRLPAGTTGVRLQAIDDAGNLGRARTVAVAARRDRDTGRERREATPRPAARGGVAAPRDGTLPFTGFLVLALLALGLAMLAGGRALRRRAAHSD